MREPSGRADSPPLFTSRSIPDLVVLAFGVWVTLLDVVRRGWSWSVLVLALFILSAFVIPWRVQVLDDGLRLSFPARWRVAVVKESARIQCGPRSAWVCGRRFKYPIPGLMLRGTVELRDTLVAHGFDVEPLRRF
jgi:hypothetical protein